MHPFKVIRGGLMDPDPPPHPLSPVEEKPKCFARIDHKKALRKKIRADMMATRDEAILKKRYQAKGL